MSNIMLVFVQRLIEIRIQQRCNLGSFVCPGIQTQFIGSIVEPEEPVFYWLDPEYKLSIPLNTAFIMVY